MNMRYLQEAHKLTHNRDVVSAGLFIRIPSVTHAKLFNAFRLNFRLCTKIRLANLIFKSLYQLRYVLREGQFEYFLQAPFITKTNHIVWHKI
jgi:hypothetical protein